MDNQKRENLLNLALSVPEEERKQTGELDVGYDRENCDSGKYRGPVHIDHYGRTVPKGAHGTVKLDNPTNLAVF